MKHRAYKRSYCIPRGLSWTSRDVTVGNGTAAWRAGLSVSSLYMCRIYFLFLLPGAGSNPATTMPGLLFSVFSLSVRAL